MLTKRLMKTLLAGTALAAAAMGSTASHAAIINLAETGSATGFVEGGTDFDGLHFDQFSQFLSSADLPVSVSQGDTVNTTVTFDGVVTIPGSEVRTDLVQYLSGDGFPDVNTQVDGDYTFFLNGDFVSTFHFSSTTSGGLASFAAVFPPNNGPFSFDSFTDNFFVTTLDSPGVLDHSSFTYSLVSNLPPAVPEPATWGLMLVGFGGLGAMLRRRRAGLAAI
jgi:hypothetical protein